MVAIRQLPKSTGWYAFPGDNGIKITDVIGITSQFTYDVDGANGSKSNFIVKLKTPYGDTTFTKTENGTTRSLETIYPDGDTDRVEYNQSTTLGVHALDPVQRVP